MKNTLIYPLIASLSERECQEARRWLCSPIHNTRPQLVGLFDYLCEQHHYLKLMPVREKAFAKLHPNKPYDDQQLRLACSYLNVCLEDWLAWRQWQSTPTRTRPHLLQAYRERGLDKAFDRQVQRQRQALERQTLRHHAYHWHDYLLEHEHYLWQSQQGRAQAFNFPAQDQALQLAFMSHKLRLACLSQAHQRVSGQEMEIGMLPQILELATAPPFADAPAVSVYYYAYRMYAEGADDAAYRHFERVLFMHLASFPEGEKRDLLLLGINFCIRQINKQGRSYFKEALDLYRRGLADGLLLENGRLTAFTYSNITIIAIRSGELDWVASFLSDYRRQLAPHQRDTVYALNAARLAYHQGAHREALRHLHHFKDRDFFHTLSAKIIQLKIYYEAGDHQLLAAHIKNTRALLRREKRHAYHKQIYQHIFALTEQLMKLPPYDKARRERLRQQISDTEPLTERAWLLAQLER